MSKLNNNKENNKKMVSPAYKEQIGTASVLDLGSNSIKLVNYKINSHYDYKPYHQESVRVKLSEGLENGIIKKEYIDNTIETLKLFRNIVEFEDVNYVISVATSAIRDAENRFEIIERIRNETKFDFKILSEDNEAIFSYAGAIQSLRIPSVVFFDMGGGSLEIVVAKNFEIKKVCSLPLGALKLTQKFSKNGQFEILNFFDFEKYVFETLPTKEELGISDNEDIVLVGVGGTLRALAKYDQYLKNYPLSKLHNYKISYESMANILKRLRPIPTEKISKIQVIGNSRADTVKAGNTVICQLMKKLDFKNLIVCAQGLREGSLSLSLQYPNEFVNQNITYQNVKDAIFTATKPEGLTKSVEEIIQLLSSMSILSSHERLLLSYALYQIDKLWSFRDTDNVLFSILDDDSALTHREQLIVGLALIYSKKKKKIDPLILRFENILELEDKKIIKKISSVISLCDIFHRTFARVQFVRHSKDCISLNIHPQTNVFPEVLLKQICQKIENTLKISITPNVIYSKSMSMTSNKTEIV